MLAESSILIVDDNPDDAEALRLILDRLGVAPAIAYSGEEALRHAAATPPDLILIDVHMPVMDGVETCRLLKARPETADIPVIFVTGGPEDVERAFAAGGSDYVLKPVGSAEAQARLQRHLESRRQYVDIQQQVQQRTQELQRANRILDRLGQMKSGLMSSLQHELRTPLTGVQGAFELLRSCEVSAEQESPLAVLGMSIERLGELIEDFRELAALETGGRELHCRDFVLRELLQYEVSRQDEAGRISLEFNADIPRQLHGDVGRIGQFLRRFLSGALALMPAGPLPLKVSSQPVAEMAVMISLSIPDQQHQLAPQERMRLRQALREHEISLGHLRDGLGMNLPLAVLTAELLSGSVILDGGSNEQAVLIGSFQVATLPAGKPRRPAAADGN